MVKLRCWLRTVLLMSLTMGLSWVPGAKADLNDGLVAYYPFDGNANDASGNGTQINLDTAIYYVNGIIAQGVASTETDKGGQISVSKPFEQEYFTISYWNNAVINHNKTYGDTNISVWHSTEPSQRSFVFSTSSGNHSAYHQHEYPELHVSDNINNAGQGTSLYYGENQLNERQWHHILLTYENGNIDVFVNGLPIIQNKLTSVSPIGRDMLISLRGYDLLDELRIYNRVLSESEIQQLYQMNNQPSDNCWAIYENGSLHIPCVKVMGPFGDELHYEADMQYEPLSEPMSFQLTGAKPK